MTDALVSTADLAARLGAPDLRVVDAGYFLPEHQRDAAAEYRAGHIPGALFLDLATLADPDTALPAMLPGTDAFAARMAALGLAGTERIVLYDDSPLHSAARAWWMLRGFGLHVAILDGGLARWRAEGRAIETGSVTPAAARFAARPFDAAAVRSLPQMQAAHEQIVDARAPARFAGAEPEPRPGTRPGHIPGARNLPYARLFAADGRWLTGDALRTAFVDAGVDPDRPVVATCGSGITAAVLAFGLHLLGQGAAVYDGSWAEWGADPATAKATGPA